MNLTEFIAEERQRLIDFERWYRKQMAKKETAEDGSLIWPEEMGSGDWDEQFHMFDPAEADAD